MRKYLLLTFFCLLFFAGSAAAAITEDAQALLSNPHFRPAPDSKLPASWSVWKPAWQNAACTIECFRKGLLIHAKDPYAVGGLTQDIENIKPGQAYAIEALCEFQNIPTPYQSVMIRLY